MVIKKPYAFLIKHFRALHLILFGCLLYLFTQMNDLHNFFATLQKTATYTYVGTDAYVNDVVYFFSFIGLLVSGIIYWLFKVKKKPSTLYLLMIIYFIAYSIVTWYLYIQLGVLKIKIVNVDDLILYKDIAFLVIAPSYVLLFLTLLRGVGFNVKQFNFSKDISELEIADMDSSEVEVLVGKNNYIYLRTLRRSIREFKYYVLENKYIISMVGAIILGLFIFTGFVYYQKYEKKLSESESTNVDGITYTVNSSYVTAYDDKGNLIKKGSKYVVINMKLFNSSPDSRVVDFSKIHLANNSLSYFPLQTKNSKFYDLGIPYIKGEIIPSGKEITRLFVFEIPDSVKTKSFVFKVQYEIENTLDDIVGRYKNFNVSVRDIDTKEKVINKKIGTNISSNILGINKVNFKILDYSLQDIYNNKYVVCKTVDDCRVLSSIIKTSDTSLYTMLVINYEGDLYDNSNITYKYNTFNKLLSNYATISYVKNGKTISVPLELTTDDEVKNMVFLKVDRKILESPRITFNLNFRNIRYEVILKN